MAVSAVDDVGVIRSKLAPGRLPAGSISRPVLLDVLRSGRDRTLTMVSAPAGFGKTTLLAEWVAADADATFVWLSLDKKDADPVRLWTHLISSLALSRPSVGRRSLAELRRRPSHIGDHVLPILFEELAEECAGDIVVILDDYYLAENASVDATVESFMRYRPLGVQLVISTRYDPALGVPRLRASGALAELRATSLRFDVGELSSFFAGIGVTGLSDDDEARLEASTGGWPAPLRLAAILMPDNDRAAFIDGFTGRSRPVVDYLTSDVLELLDPPTQEFVLQVSILSRMSAPLCDAVVGASGSSALLASLERSNLFVSVDASGQWYQQHHLFSEALGLELGRTRPELVPVLHRRASAWFEGVGDLESATDHAIAAHDLDLSTRLVAAQAMILAATGRWATVAGWLAQLSWPAARSEPELAFIRATGALFAHQITEAEDWLDVAQTGSPDRIGAMGLPLGYRTDFLRAISCVNDVAKAEAAAHRAVAAAPAAPWEGVALAGLGQAQYLRGAIADAHGSLSRAVVLIPDANPNLLAFATANLALVEAAQGQRGPADVVLEQMLSMLGSIGLDRSPTGAVLLMALGESERLRGDPGAASARFRAAIEVLSQMTRSAWLANAHLLDAVARWDLHDTEGFAAALDAGDLILDRLPDPGALPARSERLRLLASAPVRRVTEFGEMLSDRELTVLQLASEGLSQREIADRLYISYNTVKSHLKTTYRKLGATSREDAIEKLARLDSQVPPPRADDAPTRRSPG